MILEPGFLDHWKTVKLVNMLKAETAPLLVIRLWEHCQQRKRATFPGFTAETLAAVCRWTGDPSKLWDAMMAAGFIRHEAGAVIVHDWEESNRSLIAAWANGRKGGRPLKRRVPAPTQPPPQPEVEEIPAIPLPPPVETPVELPPRFPRTEREAVAACAVAGCPESFAVETWNLAMSRNGRDAKGQPIGSWPHYLKVQFQFNTNRKEENANRDRVSGGGRNGSHPSAERNRHIIGGDAVREQSRRSAEEQRKLAESGRTPFD